MYTHKRGDFIFMLLVGKKIGFALTGSFCTFEKTIPQIERLMIVNLEKQK